MGERIASRAADGVSRRTLLSSATAVCVGSLAGCLGDDTENQESGDPDGGGETDNVGSDVGEETSALATEMIDAIDDLSVVNWRLYGMFIPEYTDSRGVEADVRILGDAYADIVEQGFDRRSMPTALDDEGNPEFMVYLEPEWATAYLDGAWSDETYYAEIEASEH